ncbi:MAG: hypothetical protein Q7T03_08595, partial [Deltaproteobacteria bacterium]|nr:hypothetical protein [Deltaproteobacteria bacterium]
EANFGPDRRAEEEAKARANKITVVHSLVEALLHAPDTKILSPNAGPHPISGQVADYLISAGIRAVVGAANNMVAVEEGSPFAIARRLLKGGVCVPNDSRINRIGALACMIDMIDLDRSAGLALQIKQVGEDVREEIGAYRDNTPPQVFSDRLAARDWNRALRKKRAIGGAFRNRSSDVI